MLYYFKKGRNTTEMQTKICAMCGDGAVIDQTCRKWFVKFCAGSFTLDDGPQYGRPGEGGRDQINKLTENDQHIP